MKRLTLDQIWNECLAMWKWIDGQFKKYDALDLDVDDLKSEWITNKGYGEYQVYEDCFFCHKADERYSSTKIAKRCVLKIDTKPECPYCPARNIEAGFNCMEDAHHFAAKPRLFYAELKRLNKIRLAK